MTWMYIIIVHFYLHYEKKVKIGLAKSEVYKFR